MQLEYLKFPRLLFHTLLPWIFATNSIVCWFTVLFPPGTYFNCIMFMVASSVVTTIMILNYHHRKADTHNMPAWVRIIFLQWIPWFLRMSRPGEKITRKTIMMSNRLKELELKEKDSKSLMANVLDMDDDFRFGNRQSKADNNNSLQASEPVSSSWWSRVPSSKWFRTFPQRAAWAGGGEPEREE